MLTRPSCWRQHLSTWLVILLNRVPSVFITEFSRWQVQQEFWIFIYVIIPFKWNPYTRLLIVKNGNSTMELLFNQPRKNIVLASPPGWTCRLFASITLLLLCKNFIKPYSEEHMLVHLLTTTFWYRLILLLCISYCMAVLCIFFFSTVWRLRINYIKTQPPPKKDKKKTSQLEKLRWHIFSHDCVTADSSFVCPSFSCKNN